MITERGSQIGPIYHFIIGHFIIALLIGSTAAFAEPPTPSEANLAGAAAHRFPQSVRVGDLLKREVLQPVESQTILGRVRDVVKQPDGEIDVVLNYGGLLGFFSRPIAVPLDSVVLLGTDMEILGFTPQQLTQFKTFDRAGSASLPPDSFIRVGLAGPSH